MKYCLVTGCRRLCRRTCCFHHSEGSTKPLYSWNSRLIEYCGVREISSLLPYFCIVESPVVWRRSLGNEECSAPYISETIWRNEYLRVLSDGTLEGDNVPAGKFFAVHSNGSEFVLLTEDYTVYLYEFGRRLSFSLSPRRIIQVALLKDAMVYLTDRMELFSYNLTTGTTTQLFTNKAIRLFYVNPEYNNIYYITTTNEVYAGDNLLPITNCRHFIDYTAVMLQVRLTSGERYHCSITTSTPIGSTGILL